MEGLHVRTTGPRATAQRGPVLFVHGFPFNGGMWQAQMDALPDEWRGLAPDLRGFGASPLEEPGRELPRAAEGGAVALHGEPVLTMDRLADDLARLLEDEGGEPAVICGLSMGGYAAFALFRRHPRLVRALVLADTRAGADSAEARQNRARTARTIREHGVRPIAAAMVGGLLAPVTREDRPGVVDQVRRMIEGTAPATVIAALAGMAERPDSSPLLPRINVPTLVVVGEHDQLTPPEVGAAMAGAIPEARLEVLAGAGHLTPLENPTAFNSAMLEILGEL